MRTNCAARRVSRRDTADTKPVNTKLPVGHILKYKLSRKATYIIAVSRD